MKRILLMVVLVVGAGIVVLATRTRESAPSSSSEVVQPALNGPGALPAVGGAGGSSAGGDPSATAGTGGVPTEGQSGSPGAPGSLPATPVASGSVAGAGGSSSGAAAPGGAASAAPGGSAGPGQAAAPAATPGGTGAPSAGQPTAPPAAAPSTGQSSQQGAADATAILRRASTEYSSLRSMQAEFTQQLRNAIMGRTYHSRGSLYQRSPDRFLMRYSDPEGDVIVSDGRYLWYYVTADPGQVIRSPASAGAGFVDLQAQFVGDPTQRFDYTLHAPEQVAGRDAHVLTLVPKERGAGYRSLKVWLDTRDHLARRFEITEENGNVRRIELSGLQVNPSLPDSLFRYTPPADVRVVDR